MVKKIISSFFLLLLSAGFCNFVKSQNNPKPDMKTKKAILIPVESFKHSDIGNPAIAGSVKSSDGGFDVTAGGADVWGTRDEFNFAYIERTGDFDIMTRIESLSATHLYTKAGIMAREDLSSSCRHIFFQVFPNNDARNKNNGGYEFQYRQNKEGEMKAIYPERAEGTPEFPVSYPNTWIRLQRVKNAFTGYFSSDGINWKVYTTYSLELPAKVYLGLAVTSHDVSKPASAKFRNISDLKN
jgi:hypothetical protein